MTEQLSIAYRPLAELKAHPGNPRTHSPKQIRQIARSIEQFGFNNPILLDQEDRVLAGHAGSRRRGSSAWRRCRRSAWQR